MFEKVNPAHPDKIADRIAGAIVDYAYSTFANPRIAVEVLIGHGQAQIISETSVAIPLREVKAIVKRIAGDSISYVAYDENIQDKHLADNQMKATMRCGDNGIFKGCPVTEEESKLTWLAKELYNTFDSDGKYILDDKNKKLIICQSNTGENTDIFRGMLEAYKNYEVVINPLGAWTGGTDVDTGATNRKLGSDMGQAVTGAKTLRRRM